FARLPNSNSNSISDPEAQRLHTSPFAGHRMPINLPQPTVLRTCARGTISALPFDSTPTRSAVSDYFTVTSPSLSRGTYPPPTPLSSEDDEADLPSYSEHIGSCDDGKPFLLSKFLFKYGFLFPLLWFLSIIILFIPLTHPPNWEPHKSPAERAALLRRIRATELIWARLSLCAACIFLCLVALTVTIFMVATAA
ncbi:hypothetical protein B0F90DRAFT_1703643, partial [Multifurca ochricompacta]